MFIRHRRHERLRERVGVEPRAEIHDQETVVSRLTKEAKHKGVVAEHRTVQAMQPLRRNDRVAAA
jgi:hypothetical protein